MPGHRASLHNFNYGIELINYNILPGDYQPASDSSLVVAKTIEREKALESAIYFEDKLNLSDNLSLQPRIKILAFLVHRTEAHQAL